MFNFLLLFSLLLIISDIIPALKKYSLFLTTTGMILFSGNFIYEFFAPKDYLIGALLVFILAVLTIFSNIDKYDANRIWFLIAGILAILFIFLPVALSYHY